MSVPAFCTACGAARAADARFCTSCGAQFVGPNPASPTARVTASTPATAVAMGLLILVAGGAAAYYSLRTPTQAPRAVSGSPGAPAGAPSTDGSLPTGHPSIELPKEVVAFLDELGAEADKNPESIDAAQKLARARYRASVINAAYRVSAEQALAKLLALDPANDEGLRISANIAYDAGDFPLAQKRFEAFLAKNPDDASAITDLGSALLFQDRLDDAIRSYQAAVAKDPKFMQAHFNLGIALQKQGKKEEAIASLRRALELAGSSEESQHIENALAEIEGRQPMQIAGAAPRPQQGGAPRLQQGAPAGSGAAAASAKTAPGTAPSASGGMQGSMQGGMPMPPPAPDREVPTNAATDFQRQAEKPFVTHPIVGPRVVAFEWSSASAMRAKVADFPMDQMPPFARAKFKSGMAEKLAAIAARSGLAGAVTVEVVDNESGRVMEKLDSSEAAAAPSVAPPGAAVAPSPSPPAPSGAPQ
ncbi:MAG: tetratricopeptide repeat protein [Candidatus Binatia bacterium]